MSARRRAVTAGAALAVGALALAVGVAAALAWLPEWRVRLPEERAMVEAARRLAGRLGARPAGPPRALLVPGELLLHQPPSHERAELPPGEVLRVRVVQPVASPEGGPPRRLTLDLSPAGRVSLVAWSAEPPAFERSAGLLLRAGESLGERQSGAPSAFGTATTSLYPIAGSRPPAHLLALASADAPRLVYRRAGEVDRAALGRDLPWRSIVLSILLLLGAIGVFSSLLVDRRIDLANGLLLAGVAALAGVPVVRAAPELWSAVFLVVAGVINVALIWSAGESLLRTAAPKLTTALDALRAGHLGPRGGRSLLLGTAAGAAIAGLVLLVAAAAAALPGAEPPASALRVPLSTEMSPVAAALVAASWVALCLGLGLRFLPARWAVPAAIVLGTTFQLEGTYGLRPWPLDVAWKLAVIAALVLVARRLGLAALLAAALAAYLLPAAAFSALHLPWEPGLLALAAGLPVAFVALGLVGLGRPAAREVAGLRQPAFVRRIEEERRLRDEMELLTRMQLGLLPRELPAIPGWEVAARSLLATEVGGDLYEFLTDAAGRRWIAAGDVAGHGYSCAIAHAMVKAALASLVTSERTPAEVLLRIDRVLRRRASAQTFVSLALLRLDPETGEALLANAGHPYPIALPLDAEAAEVPLPGLPLGRGPLRTYADVPLRLAMGSALVFCSDGIFEAVGPDGEQWGFDRPRHVLEALADRPAEEILEGLLAEWRGISGDGPPADDTTVVVVKRVV